MKILLLAGGDSSEREVSLASGLAIYESLKRQEHTVFAIDPLSGKSLLGSDGSFLTDSPNNNGRTAATVKTDTRALTNAITSPGFKDVEVVFIALHGGSGENGSIQCLLELAGKKFTGSNMTASAIAMNKAVTKRLFASEDILTPKWKLYRMLPDADTHAIGHDTSENFEFPVIVKPNDSGSTVGLTKAKDYNELRPALIKAAEESPNILVEEFIDGRELTVAVLDGQPLPVVEIIPTNELYDYEAKYTRGKSRYVAPAEIDPAIAAGMSSAAVTATAVIGATGLVRVDFIMDKKERCYCLELNTLPGMTKLSLAPMAAGATGIDFDELIDRMIKSSLEGR